MRTVKKTKLYSLLAGNLQATGLFNVVENDGDGISLWFDRDTAIELKKMKAKDFNKKCNELVLMSEIN